MGSLPRSLKWCTTPRLTQAQSYETFSPPKTSRFNPLIRLICAKHCLVCSLNGWTVTLRLSDHVHISIKTVRWWRIPNGHNLVKYCRFLQPACLGRGFSKAFPLICIYITLSKMITLFSSVPGDREARLLISVSGAMYSRWWFPHTGLVRWSQRCMKNKAWNHETISWDKRVNKCISALSVCIPRSWRYTLALC